MKEFNWKDLFAFTRREKRGMLVLLLLIITTIALNFAYPRLGNRQVQISYEALNKMDSLQAGINRYHHQQEQKNTFSYYNNTGYASKEFEKQQLTPFAFDPNQLEEEGWRSLGFSEKEAAMVMKYRAAGGTFYKKEDIKNLYCISDKNYNILKPYINIDTAAFPSGKNGFSTSFDKVIDLNEADTADLLAVPGLGPFYAKMILKYRDLLGGFVSDKQLAEVYGLSDKYQDLQPYVEASPAVYRKININDAGYSDLLKHPYIDKKTAYVISEHRRLKGSFKSIEDLENMQELPDSLLAKLKPYLSIE